MELKNLQPGNKPSNIYLTILQISNFPNALQIGKQSTVLFFEQIQHCKVTKQFHRYFKLL